MKTKRPILLILLCALLAAVNIYSVAALCLQDHGRVADDRYTYHANEPIDPDRLCTLDVEYTIEDDVMVGKTIAVYRVSSVTVDYDYQPVGDFKNYKIVINGITAQTEWEELANNLFNYVTDDKLTPFAEAVTNEKGIAHFEGLLPGIYFVTKYTFTEGEIHYNFKNVIAHVPSLDENNNWNYSPKYHPKYDKDQPSDDDVTYSVRKIWADQDNARGIRPDEVTVNIYKNDEIYQTVLLNDSNDWFYSWTVKNDASSWRVAEQNVPEDYQDSYPEVVGRAFTVKNTTGGTVIKTGETGSHYLYILLIFVSGIALVALGVYGYRRAARARL